MKMNIVVSTTKNTLIPKDKTLRDILGPELDNCYDGWEHGQNVQKWHFTNVSESLLDIIVRASSNVGLDIKIN